MNSTLDHHTSSDPKSSAAKHPRGVQQTEAITPGVIDFCAGMGGLSCAASDLGLRVIAGVDTNPAAMKTFAKNFVEAAPLVGSVRSTKVIATCRSLIEKNLSKGIPLVVVSGPPCQGFSVAGSRDPKDRRNKVLVAVANAVTALQPNCALIENVSMVLAEKYEERLEAFRVALKVGGYEVMRVVLDASEFGVPQRRKRAFFLVTKTPLNHDLVLAALSKHKTSAISTRQALEGLPPAIVRPDCYADDQDYGVIANHLAMQHSRSVQEKISRIEPGKGPMSYRRLHPDRPSNTLFSGHRAPPAHFAEPRSITVREAARLQGFKDSFRVYGRFGSQMEQVTNAVPPPLARAVLQVLLEQCNIAIPSNG